MPRYLRYELLIDREFLKTLKTIVEDARERIYIATYIASLSGITEDIYYAIAARERAGVDVRILLNGASPEARKYNSKTFGFLSEKLGLKTVKLTERFMHIKLYIVDDYFIIGSHNLSGSSFLNRHDISIMIRSKPLSDLLANLFNDILVKEKTESVVYRNTAGDIYYEVLVNHRVLSDLYEKTRHAYERVKIMMYIATLSKATTKYYKLLRQKQDEGVDVAVLLNGASKLSKYYNERVYERLKSIGVARVLQTCDFIHTKLFIIDDTVLLGSHNLTAASIAGRLELSLSIRSRSLANALNNLFEHMWLLQQRKCGTIIE